MPTPVADFLPLCDVLFNIIGLAAYFCDVVFDGVTVYTLYTRQQYLWFALALSTIVVSLVVCQLCSIGWYWRRRYSSDSSAICRPPAVLLVHVLAGGVLWRYCRLLLPIDLDGVKQQVRDLSMLRMIHAMCQAVPMLLLQLYLLLKLRPSSSSTSTSSSLAMDGGHRDVAVVSAALSLFSVCWALAAFGKNTRQRNVQRLVLTWPGVLSQLVWRSGTLSARLLALAVYAVTFGRWLILALTLHWLAMWLWQLGSVAVLSSSSSSLPVASDEHSCAPTGKCSVSGSCTVPVCRYTRAAAVAYVHTFCYVNVDEGSSLLRALIFYGVMLLENALLMVVSAATSPVNSASLGLFPLTGVMLALFTLGISCMTLYYRCFHVRRLSYGGVGVSSVNALPVTHTATMHCANISDQHATNHQHMYANVMAIGSDQLNRTHCQNQPHIRSGSHSAGVAASRHSRATHTPSIGVFNCRFNPPVIKRKKKKPTTFVPPPLLLAPFWRRPLPAAAESGRASSADGSAHVSSMVQQKLIQKRSQQQAELGVIQREMEQGKLPARPSQHQLNTHPSQPLPPAVPSSQHQLDSPPDQPLSPAVPPSQHHPHPPSNQPLSPAAGLITRYKRRRQGVEPPSAEPTLSPLHWYQSVRMPPGTATALSDTGESRVSWPRSHTLPRSHALSANHVRAISDLAGVRLPPAVQSRAQFSDSSDVPDEADSECDVGQVAMLRNSMLLQQHAAAVRVRQFRLRPRDYSQHETQL